MTKISQNQNLKQIQTQNQKMSQTQIRALKFLEMGNQDLREVILKEIGENPALEIVRDPIELYTKSDTTTKTFDDSEKYQRALENAEDKTETLQDHLIHQLNSMNLLDEEIELSKKLIYNLDKNGFYGSSISPITFFNDKNVKHNRVLLEKCIKRIQRMDPVGTCCRNWEESLLIQAEVKGGATPLTLFLLDGHMNLLESPESIKVYERLLHFRREWHKKSFAAELIIDNLKFTQMDVENSIQYILRLNPLPAQNYSSNSNADYVRPDIILKVSRVDGAVSYDDYSRGIVMGDSKSHFQVKYASGVLPEVRVSESFIIDKKNYQKAQELVSNLAFRESSIVLQGCGIVSAQRDFFMNGADFLCPFTRRSLAKMIGVHESTVSRMASKKSSKYIQTEWGLFPASYFFSTGIENESSTEKISSQVVKIHIQKKINEYKGQALSDLKLTQLLNEEGIKIARRTVTKYRMELGIENSYGR